MYSRSRGVDGGGKKRWTEKPSPAFCHIRPIESYEYRWLGFNRVRDKNREERLPESDRRSGISSVPRFLLPPSLPGNGRETVARIREIGVIRG